MMIHLIFFLALVFPLRKTQQPVKLGRPQPPVKLGRPFGPLPPSFCRNSKLRHPFCGPLASSSGGDEEIDKIIQELEKVSGMIEETERRIKETERRIKEKERKIEVAEEKINVDLEKELSELQNRMTILKNQIEIAETKDEKILLMQRWMGLTTEQSDLQKKSDLKKGMSDLKKEKGDLVDYLENWIPILRKLIDEKSRLNQKKSEIERDNGSTLYNDRVASLTFNMDETSLQQEDTARFAARVWSLFRWYDDTDVPRKWIAPYFPVVQSSGSGKTKMMGDFRNGTVFSDSAGKLWKTTSLARQIERDGNLANANATIIFLLCCRGQQTPSLDGVFDAAFRVPVGRQDSDRDDLVSTLDELASQVKTERVVFLFDEAQHLLRHQSWHFRCVRWWLRKIGPEHGKQVVAVFAGTTSQLTKFHEEVPISSNTRNPAPQYHEGGTELLPPFYQIYTTGLYKWKQSFDMPPDATEFERSVVHGRPLFAGLLERNRREFWKVQPAILRKLLTCYSAQDWYKDALAKASILATRVQMGETSLQVASELVAKGYATLTAYSEKGNYAQVAHLTDPVLARLSMCIMVPEYNGMEIPKGTKNAVISNIRSWSGYMAETFSNAVCLANKGDVGEIGVALYMLLCGDRLRFVSDPSLNAFSIPLASFLDFAINPAIEESSGADGTHDPALSLNFIQVTKNHLQFRGNASNFPLSDWYLCSLYESARAIYTVPVQQLYDLLVPIRIQGNKMPNTTSTYVPMLVSVKNREIFSGNDAAKALNDMRDHMHELRRDSKGIAVLILVGLDAPRWKSTFSKALASVTDIDDISYDNQVEKQRLQLAKAEGQFIVVIRDDDPFGVSQALRSCAVNEGEGAIHQCADSIKTIAFKFLEKGLEGKEDLLWYKNSGHTKAGLALHRLVEEQNKPKERVKEETAGS